MAAAIAAAASLRCLGVKKASSRGSNLHAREWPKTSCLFFYKETARVFEPINPGLSTVTRPAASSDLVSKEARAMTPNLLNEDRRRRAKRSEPTPQHNGASAKGQGFPRELGRKFSLSSVEQSQKTRPIATKLNQTHLGKDLVPADHRRHTEWSQEVNELREASQ